MRLQKRCRSIPGIPWLLSPSGFRESGRSCVRAEVRGGPNSALPAMGEGGSRFQQSKMPVEEVPLSLSLFLPSSLACKLFGIGKSSFSLSLSLSLSLSPLLSMLPYSTVYTPFHSRGRFGVLTRQMVKCFHPLQIPTETNRRPSATNFLAGIFLISLALLFRRLHHLTGLFIAVSGDPIMLSKISPVASSPLLLVPQTLPCFSFLFF